MKVRAFKRFLSQIEQLTKEQVKKLKNQLNQQNSLKVIKSTSLEVEHCPHCGGLNFYKWGIRSKLQRYQCKECKKTFNALSNTPLASVNAYASRLKNWMIHFHGVSTKYLDNYLGWMCLLDTQKELSFDGLLKIIINFKN